MSGVTNNVSPSPSGEGIKGWGRRSGQVPAQENSQGLPHPNPSPEGEGLKRDARRNSQTPPLQGGDKGWGLTVEQLEVLPKRAQEMRRDLTEPEMRLWRHLSNSQLSGHKFRRQSVIGFYIADFLCPQKALIVEVDGDTHDAGKDRVRDDSLARLGYCVVRVTNGDVMTNMEGVLTLIADALDAAPLRWADPKEIAR